jgi:hypothetical protein
MEGREMTGGPIETQMVLTFLAFGQNSILHKPARTKGHLPPFRRYFDDD